MTVPAPTDAGDRDLETPVAQRNLYDFDLAGLEAELTGLGWKAFRARQLFKWLYHEGVTDFAAMTNLSVAHRDYLAEHYCVALPEAATRQLSADGTRKWRMRLPSGELVETVLIPEGDRRTLCVSSQVGCVLNCSFCATGKQGFNGNLDTSQIVGQVLIANAELAAAGDTRRVTNVVLMGMGEPLLNFDAVIRAVNVMTEDLALGLAKRRVTISTAGVVPAIYKMAQCTEVALAISLHAPTDELRSQLVPLNKKYNIESLIDACRNYVDVLGERRSITIEYTLMRGVNDAPEHAHALAKVLRDLRCKINLIPFNPFPGSGYERPSGNSVRRFQGILQAASYTTVCRATRGDDIDAACGQLVGQVVDRTRRQQRYKERLDQQGQNGHSGVGLGTDATQQIPVKEVADR